MKHSTMLRAAPTTKNDLAQDANCAKIKNLRSSGKDKQNKQTKKPQQFTIESDKYILGQRRPRRLLGQRE